MYTSGFEDDAMFPRSGPYYASYAFRGGESVTA